MVWGCFCMYVCPRWFLSVLLYLWCGFSFSKNAICTCSTDQDRTEEVVSQIWDCAFSIFLLVFVSFFLAHSFHFLFQISLLSIWSNCSLSVVPFQKITSFWMQHFLSLQMLFPFPLSTPSAFVCSGRWAGVSWD